MAKNKKDQPLASDEREAEIDGSASEEAEVISSETGDQLNDEEQLEAERIEKVVDTDEVVAAEDAAVTTDNATAEDANQEPRSKKAEALEEKGKEEGPRRVRGTKYQKAMLMVDRNKKYSLSDAIDLAKKSSFSRFDGSIEIHINLKLNQKGASESVRGLVQLPEGAVKTPKVAVLTEDLIEKIAKDKKTEFDILIAPKNLMPKIAKIAKVLGPQGKMPSPKAGTVVDNPEEVVEKIKSGRVEFRADKQNIIHIALGKVSWSEEKILENAKAIIGALPKAKIMGISISATMGPGVKVDLGSI